MKIGAVLFDRQDSVSLDGVSGWACCVSENDGKAWRISSVHDLPSDTTWILNADFEQMSNTGLMNHAYFRKEDFFRIKINQIIRELGMEDTPLEIAVEQIAEVFERMIQIYCYFIGIERERWRPHQFGLRNSLREKLFAYDPVVDDPILHDAVNESIQEFTNCARGKPKKGEKLVVNAFYLSRVSHAIRMLKTEVPASDLYAKLPEAQLPDTSLQREALRKWAMEFQTPFIARVTIHQIDEHMAGLINFGAISPTRTRTFKSENGTTLNEQITSTRQWMTASEIMQMSSAADIEIKEVLVFKNGTAPINLSIVNRFVRILEETELYHISYSLGLFMDNLWMAFVTKYSRFAHRNLSLNLLAPFIRVNDRIACMNKAQQIQNRGFTVMGYGAGRIFTLMPENHATEGYTFELSAHIGLGALIRPKNKENKEIDNIVSSVMANNSLSEADKVLIGQQALGDRKEFMEVDQDIVEELIKQEMVSE